MTPVRTVFRISAALLLALSLSQGCAGRDGRSAVLGQVGTGPLEGPVVLARAPAVEDDEGGHAAIRWRTDRAALGSVRFGETQALDRSAADTRPKGTDHEAVLRDLRPGATIYYRIFGDGQALSPVEHFRSGAGPGQPIHFAVIGDTGSGEKDEMGVAAELERFDPHFVLHVGDVIYPAGEDKDFDRDFFTPYRATLRHAPFFLSLGNHDTYAGNGAAYLSNFTLPKNEDGGERWYAFTWGDAKFVALDTSSGTVGPDSPQTRWLEKELAKPRPRWLFVFFHHAPYSTGEHGCNASVRATYCPLFEKAHVDVAFTGHDHHYERSRPIHDFVKDGPGVVYFVTGGGGGELRPVSGNAPWSARSESTFHFLGVDISGGTMMVAAIREDGSKIETTTISK